LNIPRFIIIAALVSTLAPLGAACEKKPEKVYPREAASSDAERVKPRAVEFSLSDRDKKILLDIARTTLDRWVKERLMPDFDAPEGVLRRKGAAFVTLRENGRLRGCIGHIMAREPLYECVRDMAVAASTYDRRFPPVRPEELGDIEVEVSVLTPPVAVDDVSDIELGRHGVIVEKGYKRGVFLPQVAAETGWDKPAFLSHLCADKAGLPPDCYNDPSVNIYTFRAIVFKEEPGGTD